LNRFDQIMVVSLNPAVDRVVEVPGFRAGDHQRGNRLARYPAGKATNVARAMSALGQPPAVSGFVGEAELQWYQQFLLGEGVEDCSLIPVAGCTRENITVVDPLAPGADTHVVEQGFSVAAADVARLRDALGAFAGTGRLVAFCGSLSPGLSVEQFVELQRLCLQGGAEVALDSSGAALRAGAELPLWLVKPNRQELAELTGSPLETHAEQRAAAATLARRIRWVLVSAGAEGAMLVDAAGSRQAVVPLAAEKVVGTVGCGDVLLAGFLAGWQGAIWQGADSKVQDRASDAVRRGVAAATCAATRLMRTIDAQSVEAYEQEVELRA